VGANAHIICPISVRIKAHIGNRPHGHRHPSFAHKNGEEPIDEKQNRRSFVDCIHGDLWIKKNIATAEAPVMALLKPFNIHDLSMTLANSCIYHDCDL